MTRPKPALLIIYGRAQRRRHPLDYTGHRLQYRYPTALISMPRYRSVTNGPTQHACQPASHTVTAPRQNDSGVNRPLLQKLRRTGSSAIHLCGDDASNSLTLTAIDLMRAGLHVTVLASHCSDRTYAQAHAAMRVLQAILGKQNVATDALKNLPELDRELLEQDHRSPARNLRSDRRHRNLTSEERRQAEESLALGGMSYHQHQRELIALLLDEQNNEADIARRAQVHPDHVREIRRRLNDQGFQSTITGNRTTRQRRQLLGKAGETSDQPET